MGFVLVLKIALSDRRARKSLEFAGRRTIGPARRSR
jgi:hypothetical protein